MDIGERLSVVVADDKTGGLFLDRPGRREAAFCHGAPTLLCHEARYLKHGGDNAMHILRHTFDYTALGFLITSMLFAAAKILTRRESQPERQKRRVA